MSMFYGVLRHRAVDRPFLRFLIAAKAVILAAGLLLASQGVFAGTQFAYPPPGTFTLTEAPGCSDPCAVPVIATNPGVTWTFSNVQLADWTETWWGPQVGGIFEFNSTPFQYSTVVTASSTLATVFYVGVTGAPGGYSQRFRMTYNSAPALGGCPSAPLNLVSTAAAGIADSGTVGVVAQIVEGQCLQVQMIFEVCSASSCPTTDLGAEWQQAVNAFPAWSLINHPFPTNFNGGFYFDNSGPTVSPLSDLSYTIVGNPLLPLAVGPVDFTVDDSGDPNDVTFDTVSSTNTAVVDPTSISFTNNDGAATISFTALPQAPQSSASTQISFIARNGSVGQTIAMFKVTVDGDTPPTIGNLSSSSIIAQENATSAPVTFTVGDAETAPKNLVVTGSSDTQSVIADGNINVTQPDSSGNASVTVTATGTSGTAKITLTVSDGQLNATTSFAVRVNAPPELDQNSELDVSQGGSGTITQSLLDGFDPDSASPVTYVVTGQPHAGTLYLNGVSAPSSFTQDDVNGNNVTYTHDGSCTTGDDFQFEVEDVDGGFANDPSQGPGPTTYSFGVVISPTETAPSAQPLSLQVALGGTTGGSVSASSTDCGPPAITYQLATPPAHGSLSAGIDPNTGAFSYTANQGYNGSDSFTFTATTYGTLVSAPATVSINIVAQAPVAQPGTLVTHENDAASGTLTATDGDKPPPALTYAIATPPTKGIVSITNSATGAYTYQPNSNVIGADSFTFTATGYLASAPATISVQIRPYLKTGDLLVTDQGNPTSIVFVDPVTGDQALFSQDAQYNTLQGIAVEADGHVLVTDTHTASVFRVDPVTGAPTLLTSTGLMNPANVAVEADGDILVVDFGLHGIMRLDPVLGTQIGSLITLGPNTEPSNVAVAGDGTLWVNDVGASFGSGEAENNLWTVNPDGSNPQILSSGNYLNLPLGLVLGAAGDAYVSTFGPLISGPTNIVHVNSAGTQTLVAQDFDLDGAPGLAMTSTGGLVATSLLDASVILVNSSGGAQTPLSVGGLLAKPFSIAVAPALPGVDLSVTVTNNLGYLPGGKTAQYKIVVQNNGNQPATNANVSDVLPANLSGESWTCVPSSGATCTASAGGAINDTVNLPVGGTLTYTVTATVAKLPETMTTYSVTVSPANGTTDIDTSNNSAGTTEMVKIFAGNFE